MIANPSIRVEIGNTSVTAIVGNAQMTLYSDKKIKKKIKEYVPGSAFIGKQRLVSYNINLDRKKKSVTVKRKKMGV